MLDDIIENKSLSRRDASKLIVGGLATLLIPSWASGEENSSVDTAIEYFEQASDFLESEDIGFHDAHYYLAGDMAIATAIYDGDFKKVKEDFKEMESVLGGMSKHDQYYDLLGKLVIASAYNGGSDGIKEKYEAVKEKLHKKHRMDNTYFDPLCGKLTIASILFDGDIQDVFDNLGSVETVLKKRMSYATDDYYSMLGDIMIAWGHMDKPSTKLVEWKIDSFERGIKDEKDFYGLSRSEEFQRTGNFVIIYSIDPKQEWHETGGPYLEIKEKLGEKNKSYFNNLVNKIHLAQNINEH